jgi:hypothetical protein
MLDDLIWLVAKLQRFSGPAFWPPGFRFDFGGLRRGFFSPSLDGGLSLFWLFLA